MTGQNSHSRLVILIAIQSSIRRAYVEQDSCEISKLRALETLDFLVCIDILQKSTKSLSDASKEISVEVNPEKTK
jgi:hypothetical protein